MDGFGILFQLKLISSSVLVVGVGGIRSTLLLLLADSGVDCITVVDHYYVEVSNLHRQVIHSKGRRGTSKSGSARNAMRDLNPTVSVMDVVYPLTWYNNMEIGRGNDCVVESSTNPRTQYLINNA